MDHNNYMFKLDKILQQAHTTTSPKELFECVNDDFWLWINKEGYRKSSRLRKILPTMPEESIQLRFAGSTGDATLDAAFSAYTLFNQIAQKNLDNSAKLNKVLDFGCGWGRIIRFFLKNVEPSGLWGIDCFPDVIEICNQTNKWCNFELIDPMPPTSFSDDTFDLIYCYSVFSHLSEEAQLNWLEEFSCKLRPGGLLIATTWPREFIMMCAELRKEKNEDSWKRGPAHSFLDTTKALSDYDSGSYLHEPIGGGGILDMSFFGESCIPKGYVLTHWTKHFSFIDFIDDRNVCPQNVIVVKKQPQ